MHTGDTILLATSTLLFINRTLESKTNIKNNKTPERKLKTLKNTHIKQSTKH